MAFKEEAEHLGLSQESGEWSMFTEEEETGEGKLSGEREEWDEDSDESSENQDSLCMILAEEKIRHHDRNVHQERTIWTYNRYEVVKNLRKLRFQGSHSGNYHATQTSERIWCQKMYENCEKDDLHEAEL